MKKLKYIISEKAIEDLAEVYFYTEWVWSEYQAERYHDLLIKEIEYLCTNISYGKQVNHIKEGYRVVKVKSHLIYYFTKDEKTIQIVRILHEKMNLDDRISE